MLSTKSFTEHNIGWLAIHSHIFHIYIHVKVILSLFIAFSKQRIMNAPGRNTFLTLKDLISLFPDIGQLNFLGHFLLYYQLCIHFTHCTGCILLIC